MSDLDEYTFKELKDLAADLGISVGRKNKTALTEAIRTVENITPTVTAPDPVVTPKQKSSVRYVVVRDGDLSAVEDTQFARIHDGWWGDNDKGRVIAENRSAKANQNDVYTGLSDEQRAKNVAAGLEQFVVR